MSSPIFHLTNVTKNYGARQVLRVADLQVFAGEILAIVGPSGSGKSTCLRLLNFVEPPTAGVIRFDGREYGANGPVPLEVRRRVTTVFQRPLLLKRSVQGNVSYGLRLRRAPNEKARVAEALRRVGMLGLARQKAATLSGGEAQRVALARAMALETDVLLLDEPTANLDPYNVGLIEEITGELNRERGTTIVLVTHNIFQARRLAHRVALLLEGELVEVADVETFFETPADPRTAAFARGEMVY